jgi:hypothetical protein
MSRQENITDEYIEKISAHEDFENPIEKAITDIKDATSVVKEELSSLK